MRLYWAICTAFILLTVSCNLQHWFLQNYTSTFNRLISASFSSIIRLKAIDSPPDPPPTLPSSYPLFLSCLETMDSTSDYSLSSSMMTSCCEKVYFYGIFPMFSTLQEMLHRAFSGNQKTQGTSWSRMEGLSKAKKRPERSPETLSLMVRWGSVRYSMMTLQIAPSLTVPVPNAPAAHTPRTEFGLFNKSGSFLSSRMKRCLLLALSTLSEMYPNRTSLSKLSLFFMCYLTSLKVREVGWRLFSFLMEKLTLGKQSSLPRVSPCPSFGQSMMRKVRICLIVAFASSGREELWEFWLKIAPVRSVHRLSSSFTLRCKSASLSPLPMANPTQNTPSASCTAPTSSSGERNSMKLVMTPYAESATIIPWRVRLVRSSLSFNLIANLGSNLKLISGGWMILSWPYLSPGVPSHRTSRYRSSMRGGCSRQVGRGWGCVISPRRVPASRAVSIF